MLRCTLSKLASRTLMTGTATTSRIVTPSLATAAATHCRQHLSSSSSSLRDDREEEIVDKTFSSDFDEADSLEVGKAKKDNKTSPGKKFEDALKDTEFYEKNYSDEFDESDSIEAGKDKQSEINHQANGPVEHVGDDTVERLGHSKSAADAESLKKNQTEVLEKQFKPEFDESDSIEVGKGKTAKQE